MADDNVAKPKAERDPTPASDVHEYAAFEEWKYDRVFYQEQHPKSWLDLAESFYRSACILVKGPVEGQFNEDVEGIAGLFLFRHYLELSLKHIIVAGRWLTEEGENAPREDVAEVERIHNLRELWQLVLRDAKPKIPEEDWKKYDVGFIERCVAEFDAVDPKGFAFRYGGQGVERLRVHFEQLAAIMEHVYQVLEGIRTYLNEMYGENVDYDANLQAEYGADLDW